MTELHFAEIEMGCNRRHPPKGPSFTNNPRHLDEDGRLSASD